MASPYSFLISKDENQCTLVSLFSLQLVLP